MFWRELIAQIAFSFYSPPPPTSKDTVFTQTTMNAHTYTHTPTLSLSHTHTHASPQGQLGGAGQTKRLR